MAVLKAVNLGVKFLLELCAFAALAWWGGTVGHGIVSVVVAIAAPLVAVLLWARFAAPRAERRLPRARRVPFELGVFALAALAIGTVSVAAGVVLAVAVAINAALLTAFDQWEN
ncbi:MAG TPA: YrdB family protein [Solirubrobacteraceae bacterium]|nr:YrdB family protein [Solirubrobacteraceae bacterium]